jgi:hypothetical protein
LLLLRWSSVSVVARRRSWGAPGQAWKAISVEHVERRYAGRESRFIVEAKSCGHVWTVEGSRTRPLMYARAAPLGSQKRREDFLAT